MMIYSLEFFFANVYNRLDSVPHTMASFLQIDATAADVWKPESLQPLAGSFNSFMKYCARTKAPTTVINMMYFIPCRKYCTGTVGEQV